MTIARRLAMPIILLAAVAAAAGLLRRSVYRDTAWVICLPPSVTAVAALADLCGDFQHSDRRRLNA
jgi:hypothetical protein